MSSANSADTHPQTQSQTPAQSYKKPASWALISLFTVLLAVSIALILGYTGPSSASETESETANLFGLKRFFARTSTSARQTGSSVASRQSYNQQKKTGSVQTDTEAMATRTPVYFLSHGGPNIMFDHDHPAYLKLGQIGREITSKVKPRAVVVFSAHWQAGKDHVEVNNAEITDLIYDFYGFPSQYYKEKYPNVGSKEIADKVLGFLGNAGINARGVKRGLDHGVWVSFKCAFEPDTNPLNVPIVQVSLFKTEDPLQHYKLGQAVSALRDENILIIVSGMAVHNLRDLQFTWGNPQPLPYTVSFDEALKDAVTTAPGDRERAMAELLKRPDARQAHPYFDHLLPIHIGAGAAGDDVAKRLWTLKEGSMSWAQFRFGEVGNSSSL
ncbi:DODA-type extradiol aromatic ring-opening family dioxygenase [Aspergillus affinis]|uniref:DODA-type extradiol aromatic ring-opening family dioxygenase n=1 Tax=Aspergillus affinis TaxID=1070780 RepID=UPI0022FE89E2|nr:uncharacterized protein KD926_000053 [Aspergillus affinis]KAI9037712.1 hypothetical protein KD926_000053 [Aspergillus affinis]